MLSEHHVRNRILPMLNNLLVMYHAYVHNEPCSHILKVIYFYKIKALKIYLDIALICLPNILQKFYSRLKW